MSPVARKLSMGVLLVTAIAAPFSPSVEVTLATGICLAVLIVTLWMDDDIPIFLIPICYQWLQVATKPIESVITGTPLDLLSDTGSPLTSAVFLSLGTLVSFACGLRAALGREMGARREPLVAAVRLWPLAQGLRISLSLIVAGYGLTVLASAIAPLRQPLLAIASVRYVGLFLLAFWSMSTKRGRTVLALVVAAEIINGLTGFFADFRGTLQIVFLGVLSARPNFKLGAFVALGIVAALTLGLAVFWSAVKPDYRAWVSMGSAQTVARPLSERLDYMANAVSGFNGRQFDSGLEALLSRLSYVDYLAATLLRVPAAIPHQDGRQTIDAVYHVFTPRALFPDKPPVPDDTEVTEFYTGIPLKLTSDGASISIGYVGELYVDFGALGAIVAAGIMGLGVGWAARLIALRPNTSPIVSYMALIIIASPFNLFEMALIKLVGAEITAILAAWLIVKISQADAVSQLLGDKGPTRAVVARRR